MTYANAKSQCRNASVNDGFKNNFLLNRCIKPAIDVVKENTIIQINKITL